MQQIGQIDEKTNCQSGHLIVAEVQVLQIQEVITEQTLEKQTDLIILQIAAEREEER